MAANAPDRLHPLRLEPAPRPAHSSGRGPPAAEPRSGEAPRGRALGLAGGAESVGSSRGRRQDRRRRLRPQRLDIARARLEREARDDVRAAHRARAVVSDRDRRARPRPAQPRRLARRPLSARTRRSDARRRRPCRPRVPAPAGRDRPAQGKHPLRRVVLRRPQRRVRLEGRVLRQRVRASLGADRRPLARRGPAARGRPRVQGRPPRGGRVRGRNRATREVERRRISAGLGPLGAARRPRPRDGHGERQLPRRDAVQGTRSGARARERRPAGRRRPRSCWRRPACRSPERASSTGRGCRGSTG